MFVENELVRVHSLVDTGVGRFSLPCKEHTKILFFKVSFYCTVCRKLYIPVVLSTTKIYPVLLFLILSLNEKKQATDTPSISLVTYGTTRPLRLYW